MLIHCSRAYPAMPGEIGSFPSGPKSHRRLASIRSILRRFTPKNRRAHHNVQKTGFIALEEETVVDVLTARRVAARHSIHGLRHTRSALARMGNSTGTPHGWIFAEDVDPRSRGARALHNALPGSCGTRIKPRCVTCGSIISVPLDEPIEMATSLWSAAARRRFVILSGT